MNLAPTVECDDPDFDPVRHEHALERAVDDLRRIVTSLAERYLSADLAHALSWAVLLEIEEQAFSDLAFQSRNDLAIIDALPRIGPQSMPGLDLSGLIDWHRAAPSLPIVYRCVREFLLAASASEASKEAA
ncbi:DUF2471 family protein [Burkholderia sp. Ac-20345]|uniref:DUF2471 family protein n=1 Tax=Burkholderia sp. Ac-20345 TaxID=2703891 RepID=UPI00197C0663|nr:DUF2471 family protein [Burkholderia sp. Ac-20345]MBN3776637.1 DUF2471 family protein [Burkholderia sp. Ac-20345]